MIVKFTIGKTHRYTKTDNIAVEEKEDGYCLTICEYKLIKVDSYSIYDSGTLIEHKVFKED